MPTATGRHINDPHNYSEGDKQSIVRLIADLKRIVSALNQEEVPFGNMPLGDLDKRYMAISGASLPTTTTGLSIGSFWVDTTGGLNIVKIV